MGEAKLVSGGGKALGLYDFQKDFKFFISIPDVPFLLEMKNAHTAL